MLSPARVLSARVSEREQKRGARCLREKSLIRVTVFFLLIVHKAENFTGLNLPTVPFAV